MADLVSLEGPIENIAGMLTLRIPLQAGGDKLAPLARGIGEVDGDYLKVVIPPWLAERLRVSAGNLVIVDNENGKLNISRSSVNDLPEGGGAA